MVFNDKRHHFVRYQLASEASSNPSTPARMTAYVTAKSTARLPLRGDVIWVLAREGDSSPGRYRFIYAFVVDEAPSASDPERRFFGSQGLWLQDSPPVSQQSWFKDFFNKMGSGGLSIASISEEWIEKLQELFGSSAAVAVDTAVDLEAQAIANGWPEDAVRYGAIKARRGQANFRARLLSAYERRCCISDCRVEALLEAAHIRPHALEPNYGTRNGLLLRADLHTLFDLHLLGVDAYGRIHLSPRVLDVYYKNMVAKAHRINYPSKSADRPNEDDLTKRMELFQVTE